MGPAVIGLLAAGTALSVYSQIKQADDQAEQARRSAALRDQEANEILARAAINEKYLQKQGDQFLTSQIEAYAKAGVTISGSPLQVLEQTKSDFTEQKMLLQRDAEYRANLQRAGAQDLRGAAEQIRQGGYLSAFGTLLGGVGNIAAASGGSKTKTQNISGGGETLLGGGGLTDIGDFGPSHSYNTRTGAYA